MTDNKKNMTKTTSKSSFSTTTTALHAFLIHLTCGFGLAFALWISHNVYSTNLISDPSLTLYLIWVIECPLVIFLYSLHRQDREKCLVFKAVGRGILALPVGALVNALGAIALGAPVSMQYLPKTVNWSLMMSLFTFVPTAIVYGFSWPDWQRIYAHAKPIAPVDFMICLPAYGAAIGGWFGAWPMPLDWERPWQDWPICVSYGAMIGYLVGMLVSMGFLLVSGRRQRVKGE